MKTSDIARLFGVSDTTIRNWIKDFSDFFDESRTKQRIYTDDDLRVLATIAKYSHQKYSLAAIREKLTSGELEDLPLETTYGVDNRLVPAAAVEQIIDSTELKVSLERAIAERDKLIELVDRLEQEKTTLIEKYETERDSIVDRYEERIATLQKKAEDLQRELGRAEGELSYRRTLDKRDD